MKAALIVFAFGMGAVAFALITAPLGMWAMDAAIAAKWSPAAIMATVGVLFWAVVAIGVGIAQKRGAFACVAVLALLLLTADADAGCRRGRCGGCSGGSCQPCQQPQAAPCQQCGPSCSCTNCVCDPLPACPGGKCSAPAAQPVGMAEQIKAADVAESDPLAAVNARRVASGLRPYILDHGLLAAARAAAQHRADNRIAAHTANDFVFLPPGTRAAAAGCNIATPGSAEFMTCAMYEATATHAGAATVTTADGRVYHHLFVR